MIYIHIPYCRSFCKYCGFYSLIKQNNCGDDKGYLEYKNLICKEIRHRRNDVLSSSFCDGKDTLYIGGGTPSLFPTSYLKDIVFELRSILGSDIVFKEFTVEVNPDDIVNNGIDYVKRLIDIGVNRISMGCQSFDDAILKWMGRRHNSESIYKAYQIILDAGITNISLDLIFGMPLLDKAKWEDTIDKCLSLNPKHISAYQLSIDENSQLYNDYQEGRFVEADDDLCLEQYTILCEKLRQHDYRHYEVSNFAKIGYEAKHNSEYWTRHQYVGLGSSAHSLIGDRLRIENSSSVPYTSSCEYLSDNDIIIENIMLALRTDTGIKKSYLYSVANKDIINKLVDDNCLEQIEDRLRIPESKFFISDQIISKLI